MRFYNMNVYLRSCSKKTRDNYKSTKRDIENDTVGHPCENQSSKLLSFKYTDNNKFLIYLHCLNSIFFSASSVVLQFYERVFNRNLRFQIPKNAKTQLHHVSVPGKGVSSFKYKHSGMSNYNNTRVLILSGLAVSV